LQLLSSATGSLLDNIQLINTLDASKTTWEQVNQSLQVCTLDFTHQLKCLHEQSLHEQGSTSHHTSAAAATPGRAIQLVTASSLCLLTGV